jgi:hypothetical protein
LRYAFALIIAERCVLRSEQEEDPDLFGYVVDYIYHRDFTSWCHGCDGIDVLDPAGFEAAERTHSATGGESHCLHWIKLYLLADRLCIPVLIKIAMDRYLRCLDAYNLAPSPSEIKLIYENTLDTAKLRFAVVKLMCRLYFSVNLRLEGKSLENWSHAKSPNPSFSHAVSSEIDNHRLLVWEDCLYKKPYDMHGGCTAHSFLRHERGNHPQETQSREDEHEDEDH